MSKVNTDKIYLVWDENDHDEGYWQQYSSLDDAISSNDGHANVYIATPRRIGTFKIASKIIRIKKRKPKKCL